MFGGFRHINAFGAIVRGDADRLLKLIETAGVPPRTTVYINSPGGDAEEGIKLGCVIRTYGLETSIGTYALEPINDDDLIVARTLSSGKCLSAATLMFAGGRLRHFPDGARFGVHRFAYKNPVPEDVEKSQVLSAGIAEFLDQMGVSLGFLSLSAGTASDKHLELGEDELREHRMVTGGATEVVWGTEMRSQMLYVRGTRDSVYGRHKVILTHAKDVGFMFFAVIEAQGRQDELCNFGVVEIVVNGEDQRIDISWRCSREPNNVDVVLMAKLTEEEARQLAYSNSFGVQIRASKEAEVFLGVSAMDTEGGQESLRSLYENMKTSSAPIT
ncbi:hypothetical protein G0P99_21790 [Ruegeria sp. PrR005]|uniref:Uncharacterized protein n=1 Tax=Ruegeria sp. PrR005 TaxID=2706882 RepID=A0A6B2P0B4_9RHOB|nr:hypothetical protein [Ruegeria sp. PrR005]